MSRWSEEVARRRERPRPEIETFAAAMERKLRAHDHKPHWSEAEIAYLLRRLSQELGELRRAIRDWSSVDDVVDEAADVANFAMMIADNYSRKERA